MRVLHLTASVRRSLCDIYFLPEALCQHLIVCVRAREDVPSWREQSIDTHDVLFSLRGVTAAYIGL